MISLLTLDKSNINQVAPFIPVNYMREALNEENLIFYPILKNQEIIGCIIAEGNGEEFVLRYMEIRADFREKGIGYEALCKLIFRAKLLGFSRMICRYIPKLNPGFDKIVTELSFTKYQLPFGFHKAALKQMQSLLNNTKNGGRCKSIRSLEGIDKNIFVRTVTEELGYGITIPFTEEVYDLDVSSAIIMDNQCLAFILVEKERDGEHYIRYIQNSSQDIKYLFNLFQFAVSKGLEKYGEDAIITAISSDEEVCNSIVAMEHVGVDPMVEAVIEL